MPPQPPALRRFPIKKNERKVDGNVRKESCRIRRYAPA